MNGSGAMTTVCYAYARLHYTSIIYSLIQSHIMGPTSTAHPITLTFWIITLMGFSQEELDHVVMQRILFKNRLHPNHTFRNCGEPQPYNTVCGCRNGQDIMCHTRDRKCIRVVRQTFKKMMFLHRKPFV